MLLSFTWGDMASKVCFNSSAPIFFAEIQELLLLVLADLLLGNGSVHKGFNTGGTQRVAFLAQGLSLCTVGLQLCQLSVDGRFVGILGQAQFKG